MLDTIDLIHGLEYYLQSLVIPSGPQAGQPAFEIVTKLDSPNLGLAVQKAIAVTERIACVVPGRDSYRVVKTSPLQIERTQEILVMISATDFEPFSKPSFFSDQYSADTADPATVNGLLDLKDLLIREMTGQPLANVTIPHPSDPSGPPLFDRSRVVIVPEYGESARFTERESPTGDYALSDIREGYLQWFNVNMGLQNVCTSRGARIRR